jgi:hypothetical protein
MFAFALLVAVAVLLNLISGAVLTNTLAQGPGDALTGVFSLLGHRHVSEGVGTLVVILAVWITFADKRGRVKIIAWAGVACVALEAWMGMITRPFQASTFVPTAADGAGFFHAFVSQILFVLLVHVAVYEWPGWEKPPAPIVDKGWPSLRGLSNSTVGALLLQVALGAAFRHNLIAVLWHILCAFVVVIFGLGMTVLITQVPENASLRAPVIWLASLLGVQVTLGMVLISIPDPAKHALFSDITVASHVATGATCLGLGVLISMLIRRAAKVAPADVPAEG